MQTIVGINDPKAVKRWATALASDTEKMSYFTKFIGVGENNVIERKVDLESDAGDTITFDLAMRLRGGMVEGDNNVEGTEENLTFYSDQVKIDQARKGADAGGRMTRKRTLHDLRKIAKDRTAEYTAEWLDELFMVYLSGTVGGINGDRKITAAFAGNPIQAPDAYHMVYGGSAVSKATLTTSDKMTRNLIERLGVMPAMMNTENPDVVKINPVNVEGSNKYILLMSPYQEHSLRTEEVGGNDLSWPDIQKALATFEGRNSPLCKGGLGEINDVILHKHANVRLFNDYGSGGDVKAARAMFLGRQAGVVAYGQAGNGTRFQWVEESKDAGNRVAIYAGTIVGAKKTRFNGYDFGCIAVDTYAANPNPAVS